MSGPKVPVDRVRQIFWWNDRHAFVKLGVGRIICRFIGHRWKGTYLVDTSGPELTFVPNDAVKSCGRCWGVRASEPAAETKP